MPGEPVLVRTADGSVVAISPEEFAAREAAGTADSQVAGEELSKRYQAGVKEQIYGDLGDRAITALEGTASGLTLGLSDLAARGLAGDEYLEDARARAEVNPGLRTATEIAGAIAPTVLTGGTGGLATAARLSPAGISSRLGARLAQGGGVGRTVAAGAVEGAIGGAGAGVSQLALAEDPLTLERAASTISTNALLGAGFGAGGGLLAKAAEKGIAKAARLAEGMGDSLRARAGVSDDLAGLDRAGLRAAKETEEATLKEAQKAQRAASADDLASYRADLQTANPWLATDDATTRKLLVQQERSFRRLLDEPIGLAESPRRALDPLRREAQALRKAIDDAGGMAERLAAQEAKMAAEMAEELATLPSSAKTVQLTGKTARRYGDWAQAKVGKAGIDIAPDEAARFQAALANGEIKGARAQALGQIEEVLAKNEALQAKIAATYEPLASPRLAAIADAGDALSKGRSGAETAALGYAASAATGLLPGGPLGAMAAFAAPKVLGKIADLVTGRLAKAVGESATRSSSAIDAFVSKARPVTRALPKAATKVLASTSFSDAPAKAPRSAGTSSRDPLLSAYRDRERELREQTAPGPDGRPQLRPAARQALAGRLSGVRAASPLLADQLETMAARRVSFLASKLPQRPDMTALRLGPDLWRPSDFAMRGFARYVAAVEDPGGIEERLAHGTVTPEDAEAMREVYPERYADLKRQLIERLPELQHSLPYARRLALSIFFGVPVDPAMQPEILAILQGNFAAEEGTEGGMQAPKAAPQFGSLSKPDATPAQRRAEG